ncbi:PREDICTED: sperm-associated antigen 6 [Odobenus rosmarus divergens]|uniref:Sperm-associated antigen 6 n=1 Tax=Odobenus rosmarus divergens TaxID=9708 RepID=A0A9B0LGP8_ODORO
MSQRQVLQGKARGARRPDGLAAGAAGAPGRPAPPCFSSAVFEQYQKARTQFVQMVAELATRPQNIETLQNAGVMSLLRPLLLDVVPTIQQTAALALGRLANYNDDLAEAVVKGDILPQLVYSLAEQNRFYKKAAAFVLRAVGKHSPQLAQAIVDCGALDTLVICLEDFDPGVKEAAAWALGYIGRHNAELSQAVVDAGAVPLLVLCIQEPEIALKRIAASALSDISKHSPELAQTVVDAGAIAHLAQMILNPDSKLKRQVLSALSQIAKHSVDLAEMVVEAEIFPVVLTCLKDKDEYVKKNASTLIREIAKHTPELSQLIVNAGGVAAVIDCIGSCKGNIRLPGIMMLGYVAAHSENLAMAVIISKGVPQLSVCLSEEPEDHIKAAAAWALGQIGRHTPEHARAVAVTNTLPVLLSLYMSTESSEDLQVKSKKAIKNILQKCTYLPALEPFLYDAPPNILKHVVGQFSKVLPHDSKARRLFVTSGGLKKVQEIKAEPGSLLQEYINSINNCYPEEIVSKFFLEVEFIYFCEVHECCLTKRVPMSCSVHPAGLFQKHLESCGKTTSRKVLPSSERKNAFCYSCHYRNGLCVRFSPQVTFYKVNAIFPLKTGVFLVVYWCQGSPALGAARRGLAQPWSNVWCRHLWAWVPEALYPQDGAGSLGARSFIGNTPCDDKFLFLQLTVLEQRLVERPRAHVDRDEDEEDQQ